MKNKLINHYHDTQFFLLCILAGFPVLPKGVQSVLIVLMSFLALFYFLIDGRKYWNTKKTKYLAVLGSLFVIYSFSLLYTENVRLGLKYLTRLSPMIMISILFLSSKFTILDVKRLYKLLVVFIIALTILLLFLYFSFFDQIYNDTITPWELRSHIEELINIHGTYLSMWTGMGVLILIWLLHKISGKIWLKILGCLFLVYFYYWLYIIGARMPFFATLISSVFLVLFLLKVPVKAILAFFVIAGISGFITFKTQVFSKIEELGNYENAIPIGKYENTNPLISNENIRSVIYYCSSKKIKKEVLFGYGVGDVNQQLQECYDNEFNHTDLFKRFQFNSHSQYLQVFLSVGFIGFLIYLISIMVLVKWSFKRSKLYVSFLILVFLCFTFENILYRHDGIIFFSFFNAILFFTSCRKV